METDDKLSEKLCVCVLADRHAGRQWGNAAGGTATEEEMPEADSWAPGHQTPPGRPAESQPWAGEETKEVRLAALKVSQFLPAVKHNLGYGLKVSVDNSGQ